MSQIIIVESAAVLAEQIVRHQGATHISTREAVLSCLHPIEVPSDAVELAREVVNEMESPFDTAENREKKAAALITAYSRTVPREMLQEAHILGRDDDYYDRHFEHKNIDAIAAKYGYRAE